MVLQNDIFSQVFLNVLVNSRVLNIITPSILGI